MSLEPLTRILSASAVGCMTPTTQLREIVQTGALPAIREEVVRVFEVRNKAVEDKLNDIGQRLRAGMPSGFGFVLLIAEFGEKGSMFYTANCNRQDVCNMMREFISKNEPN